ncbi:MAG: hypothetical protein JO167_09795 [Alphaproteobacteria bacterium]|nr:hypothetical protein [Alphaproteobacteria bacterium]MBV9905249.1 hypothetical protein [Alphaproteobacteria bacterium]
MPEPEASNTAQQNQDEKLGSPGAERDRKMIEDRRMGGPGSGAVRGGEAAKPGQMDGDDDLPSDPPLDPAPLRRPTIPPPD